MEMNEVLHPDKAPFWLAKYFNYEFANSVISNINEDDCAIIKIDNTKMVFTMDFLNSNPIAVELGIATLFDLGRLLVAANISDLCGSGAYPLGFMAGICLQKKTLLTEYKKMMKGVKHETAKYKMPLIGGDTKLGKENSFVGMALGYEKPGTRLFLKSGAKAGDLLWVSGPVGAVSAALYGLTQGKLNKTLSNWAKKQILKTEVPLQKSIMVAESGCGNGGTDISDGLGVDVFQLCQASKLGVVIDVEKIPVAKEVELIANLFGWPTWVFSFGIGGDFQFVVTTKKEYEKLMISYGFTNIGWLTKNKKKSIKHGNKFLPLPREGHEDGKRLTFEKEIELILDRVKNRI